MKQTAYTCGQGALVLIAIIGAYFGILWLHQTGTFPAAGTESDRLEILEQEIAIVGGLVALVAAFFAISGGQSWLLRFYDAQQQAQNFQKNRAYADLDEFYIRILNVAIEKPYLRMIRKVAPDERDLSMRYAPFADRPQLNVETLGLSSDPAGWSKENVVRYYELERAMTDYREREYDAYAFMVWNFLETIHDRCEEHPDLLNTWAPIVAAENEYHRGWFLQQMRDQVERRVEAVKAGKRYIRSDKFCRDFQVFIYEYENFCPDPLVAEGADPTMRYPKWRYETGSVAHGIRTKRDFSKAPGFIIDGREELVWPEPASVIQGARAPRTAIAQQTAEA